MRKIDRDALKRAMQMARKDPLRAEQLAGKLASGESWQEVAEFAAYCMQSKNMQSKNLRLKPWQCPPCSANDEIDPAEDDRYGNMPGEVGLRQRLKRAGLSTSEPDPLAALAALAAEAQAKAAANPAEPVA